MSTIFNPGVHFDRYKRKVTEWKQEAVTAWPPFVFTFGGGESNEL